MLTHGRGNTQRLLVAHSAHNLGEQTRCVRNCSTFLCSTSLLCCTKASLMHTKQARYLPSLSPGLYFMQKRPCYTVKSSAKLMVVFLSPQLPGQWFSTHQMLRPFNTVFHVVVTPKLFLLPPHNCNLASAMNHSVNPDVQGIGYVTPVNRCFRLHTSSC